jgi:hypothetical protein
MTGSRARIGAWGTCIGIAGLAALGACEEVNDAPAIEGRTQALTADNRNVWTNCNNNNRTCGALYETILGPSTVNPTEFGKVFERAVDDEIYAQPLWLANVPTSSGTRNVVYVATTAGTVYAFDADDPSNPSLTS